MNKNTLNKNKKIKKNSKKRNNQKFYFMIIAINKRKTQTKMILK